MRMTVIGTGRVGAVHAVCMADLGHTVLGVDIDPEKATALAAGRPFFHEPGLAALLRRTLASGRLRFTSSLTEAAQFADTHFLCVPTPQRRDSGAADLSHFQAAADSVMTYARACGRDQVLLVGKSTVPVGTAERLVARLGPAADVASNPEFLREGHAIQDTLRPERVVAGVRTPHAEARLREIYAPMARAGTPLIVTDTATAELVKLASNAFLATKISFINAMAEICDATGADVLTLAGGMAADSRIGSGFLVPGLGFGGSCLAKDIRALAAHGEELGLGESVAFLRQVDAINTRQRLRVVRLAERLVGGSFAGRNVGILGAAFKPRSDDVRDSPALAVAEAIRQRGAQVRVHDPEAVDNARAAHPALQFALEVGKACEQADVVLHLTEWAQYRGLDPEALAAVVRVPAVVDARHTLDPALWRAAGWTLRAPGRPRLDRPAV
ncbi:UDP-glucose dehydrogenase family protein [Streptomyces sp. NPDC096205]|uniref:UDP-glucose dehydrogenase family protein n=1 Tax=Streptomyces sp. NPDC096205 TaxID=3366081 RepID=UPI0037F96B48